MPPSLLTLNLAEEALYYEFRVVASARPICFARGFTSHAHPQDDSTTITDVMRAVSVVITSKSTIVAAGPGPVEGGTAL